MERERKIAMIEHEPKDAGRSRVRVERTIAASLERVWRAWVEPQEIARWFVDRASGQVRAGETVVWHWDAFGFAQPFQVERADRSKEIDKTSVIELSAPPAEGSARRVIASFRSANGSDSTHVEVVEGGFAADVPEQMLIDIESGWQIALALLAYSLQQAAGRDRRQWFAMRPVDFLECRLIELFSTDAGLRQWLADEATFDATAYSMRLTDTGFAQERWPCASGKVLAATRRERALTWDELDGVLTLKAFSAGPMGRHVALALSSWHPDLPELPIDRWMSGALDRLRDRLIVG
jgi:uncharacterized protein YndB with AHSA1/START domain